MASFMADELIGMFAPNIERIESLDPSGASVVANDHRLAIEQEMIDGAEPSATLVDVALVEKNQRVQGGAMSGSMP